MTEATNPLREIKEALEPCLKARFSPDPEWSDADLADYWVRELVQCQSAARRALALIDALEPLEGLNQKALDRALTEGDEAIVTGLGRGKDYDEAAKIGMRAAIAAYLSHLKEPRNV